MMKFEYDPRLVEQATFLAARRVPERECAMHERLDPLYRIADAESRQRAFREAYSELFRRLGLDRIVPAFVLEFPLLSGRIGRCIVREADRRRAQSVDLYRDTSGDGANGDERVLIIALCPECLVDQDRLRPWLYRQLRHIEDMVDERFEYERELPGTSTAQRNLVRDRYALLWDIFVEGRLIRSGILTRDGTVGLQASFDSVFSQGSASPSRLGFEWLLDQDGLTHAQLMSWAVEPHRFPGEEKGGSSGGKERAKMVDIT